MVWVSCYVAPIALVLIIIEIFKNWYDSFMNKKTEQEPVLSKRARAEQLLEKENQKE